MFQKKKLLITLAIVCASVVGLFVAGKITGALSYATARSGSSAPAIKPGDFFFTSNLITPKQFDFIAYHRTDPMLGKMIVVHRVCGMPGDTIQIKDGNLYVNGQSADDSTNLNLAYLIPAKKTQEVIERFNLSGNNEPMQADSGKAIVYLSRPQVATLTRLQIPFERCLLGKRYPAPEIEALFNHPWTIDDFGPVEVPANHYFVLGDNRYFAQDSRYVGFIEKSQLYGVVLGIK